jgi:hypothetical protein
MKAPNRTRLLFLVGGALCVAFLVALSARWWRAPENVRTGALTVRNLKSSGLVVKAWVGSNRASPGSLAPFWILFENESGRTLTNLRFVEFSLGETGFVKSGRCWSHGLPNCIEAENTQGFPLTINSAESVIVSAELMAGSDTGRFEPAAVYEWTDWLNNRHRDVITLGPISVVSGREERTIAFGRRFLSVLRDIAIPLLIFAAGIWIQRWSQRYSEVSQLRQNFLPRTLSDAQKYYMPMSSRLGPLQRSVRNLASAGDEERDEALWSLLRFLCQASLVSRKVGGLQFKNRRGEGLVGDCYQVIRKASEVHFGKRNLSYAVREMAVDEPFVTFLERLETAAPPLVRTAFLEIRGRFGLWIADTVDPLKRYAPVIEVFQLALCFELNAPFLAWYEEEEPFPKEGLAAEETALTQSFPAVGAKLKDYLQSRQQK